MELQSGGFLNSIRDRVYTILTENPPKPGDFSQLMRIVEIAEMVDRLKADDTLKEDLLIVLSEMDRVPQEKKRSEFAYYTDWMIDRET